MPYHVRLMRREDIAQVTDIDREAFPSLWPPTNYRHELENRMAHYMVAVDESKTTEAPPVYNVPEKGLTGLLARIRRLFNHHRFFPEESAVSNEYVAGFAGFWIMAEEAHVVSISVREAYRHQGIGELLLISLIDLAIELEARLITLEVRVSNTIAQNLYRKYGFVQVGVRRGYYTDNKEDGVLMTADNIGAASFRAQVEQLKKAHAKKWGMVLSRVSR
ncbi:MAG: ribosomal protein S18-alanine N-acetyltransferase [Chloroflexota bacterium]|nr:ribosomal protein S18-alanine N-acetyltransferase [Chloroflexota bacterium]